MTERRCQYSGCEHPPIVFYGAQRKVGLCLEHYPIFDSYLEVVSEMGYPPKDETKILRQHVLDWARAAGHAKPKSGAYSRERFDD